MRKHGVWPVALAFWLISLGAARAEEVAPTPDDIPSPVAAIPDDLPAARPETVLPVNQPGAEPNLPEAPETTVIGRPGAFPNQPLPADAAISPTLTETPVNQVGSSLSVITREDIKRTEKTNVTDVLRSVPGLDVVQSGPAGGVTSVFIRGANSGMTKVLLDGMPLNDPSNASRSFDMSLLDVEQIERIEVLRGPQSMLYGSDAMGGVVNIITKRGEGPPSVQASLMGGTYGTAREGVSVSGGNKTSYYSLGASYIQSDSFSAADRIFGNTERDPYQRATCGGRFGLTPSEDLGVDYVFRWIDQRSGLDDISFGAVPVVDAFDKYLLSNAFYNRIQTRWAVLDGAWEQKVGFSYVAYDRTTTNPGMFDVPRFLGQTRRVDYLSNFLMADWNTLSVGVDYMQEEADSQPDPWHSQFDKGVFFQEQFFIGDNWTTTAGCRYDDNNLAGTASTYRITTRYQLPGPKTAWHGSIGTGFRAPSLAEQFFFVGNPDLLPERSFGWDVGLEQPFADGRFTIDGTYFRNDFTDLVQFDLQTFTLRNIGSSMSSGTELTANWKLDSRTTLVGTYVYTFTENRDTGTQLLRRAPHKAGLAINRSLLDGQANVNLNCNYVSPRLDQGNAGYVTLQEYWLVNLAGTYNLNQHWQLFGRVDNLLNDVYEEVYGYGTSRLAFYAGTNVHW